MATSIRPGHAVAALGVALLLAAVALGTVAVAGSLLGDDRD